MNVKKACVEILLSSLYFCTPFYTLKELGGNMIAAGDLNARAIEWSMPLTNSRSRVFLEMAARLHLRVVNVVSVPTYRKPGFHTQRTFSSHSSRCL